jgi:DNA-binding SARP family transcriptional activator
MIDLVVRLLGRQEIERGGVVVASPRGRKVWCALAYLMLSEQPVSRTRLASLLFSDAEDPLGAVRWTLSQLRLALGLPDVLRGDPLECDLPEGVTVDVHELSVGDADPALVRGELLEDINPDAGEAFAAWLLLERRRLSGLCEGVLRDAALVALAGGVPLEGAQFAARAVELNPFDESSHELLVRCLAKAGEFSAARHQASMCEALFRRELGRAPDPRVRWAAGEVEAAGPPATGDRAAAVGQLQAGLTALAAGATEPGIECLRMACAEARAYGDPDVLARSLSELGIALVHVVRGRDEEGASLLHEALAVAEQNSAQAIAARSCRELGYVEVQAGRGASAGRWLKRATMLAVTDDERAAVLGVRGMALSDRAHYQAAGELLRQSVAIAEHSKSARQEAWSSALLGRTLLLCGDLPAALESIDRSLLIVERDGWIAFLPLPEALRAEVALRDGDPQRADALSRHAFALGCRLGDPCWEALAGRVLGLVHEARGNRDAALACLRDASARAVRVADPYQWVHAHCLHSLAELAIEAEADDAATILDQLERLAARCDMRELIVRSALLRARLGHPAELEAVRPLAETIDSPALHAALAALD